MEADISLLIHLLKMLKWRDTGLDCEPHF